MSRNHRVVESFLSTLQMYTLISSPRLKGCYTVNQTLSAASFRVAFLHSRVAPPCWSFHFYIPHKRLKPGGRTS
nr:MAG TPA: hypothetical protein [Caudoviricetes sp.]